MGTKFNKFNDAELAILIDALEAKKALSNKKEAPAVQSILDAAYVERASR